MNPELLSNTKAERIRRVADMADAKAHDFGGTGPRSHTRVAAVHVRDYVFLAACLAVPVIALVPVGLTGSFSFFGS